MESFEFNVASGNTVTIVADTNGAFEMLVDGKSFGAAKYAPNHTKVGACFLSKTGVAVMATRVDINAAARFVARVTPRCTYIKPAFDLSRDMDRANSNN